MTIVNSPYLQGFIFLLVIWAGYSAYVRYEIAVEMKERSEVAKEQLEELEEHKEVLEEQVDYLSSERGIEAEMRRQFDVALPGEQVVVIVDDEEDGPEIMPMSTSTNIQSDDKKWYQFWR